MFEVFRQENDPSAGPLCCEYACFYKVSLYCRISLFLRFWSHFLVILRTQGFHLGALSVHFGDPGLPKKLQSEPFETSCVFLAVFVELWVSLGDSFGVIFATFSSFVVPQWEVRLWVSILEAFGRRNGPSAGAVCR